MTSNEIADAVRDLRHKATGHSCPTSYISDDLDKILDAWFAARVDECMDHANGGDCDSESTMVVT